MKDEKYPMFLAACIELGIDTPQKEVVFASDFKRRWRIDYLFNNIAVEIEGGVFIKGRHSRGVGMTKDAQKYNCMHLLGYKLLRFTAKQAKKNPIWCAQFVKAAIDGTTPTELFKTLLKDY